MKKHMDLIGCLALVGLVVTAAVAVAGDREEKPITHEGPRVGTFNTRGVALAYGRSPEFMEMVRQMKADHAKAEEEGDEERVAELEKLGPELQDRLHRQVFGDAPIPEILVELESHLPGIAEAAGVDMIVGDILYSAPGAETIDITRHMMRPFDPSEETLEILEELLATQPVDMDELDKREH